MTDTIFEGKLKCNRCIKCNGKGCIGLLPGLGGVYQNKNFQLNCSGWQDLRNLAYKNNTFEKILNINITPSQICCGPVTGAVENIGFKNEEDFYYPYLKNSFSHNFGLCVGDGYPDEKLKYGIEAINKLNTKAAFFLKPYPDNILYERIEWVKPYSNYIGIDIDSFNILTMRNLVNLEQKNEKQLSSFRQKTGCPFIIKGVFSDNDIDLVKRVKPDVVYISNHGGRVETRVGSTAEFLERFGTELKNYCSEIWIDGGIRTKEDIQTALYYGADKVILARPFIRATFDNCFDSFANKLL